MDELLELFQDPVGPAVHELTLTALLARLALALFLGCVIGLVYRLTQRRDTPVSPSFVATLVLLCVIIAVVTQVVGDRLGRAFTLVGALSIVRFRTIVEDTRDTAFVIFAVVIGMGAGLGKVEVSVVGLGVVSGSAMFLSFLQRFTFTPQADWTLQLRVGTGAGAEMPWEGVFARHCEKADLQSTATARQGAALDLTYKLSLKAGVTPLQFLNDLNRIEGIQNIELKRS